MEAVKSYKIPVKAPTDLLNAYFKLKKKTLKTVFPHVKIGKKAHLHLEKEDRRKLRNELLKDWKYSKHYVDSAIDSVIGLVKGWIQLYNRGKTKNPPEITRKTVYVKNTLFSFKEGILKISIEAWKRYLKVDLKKYNWIPKDFDEIGGLFLKENELIITLKKSVEPKAEKWTSFDVNLTNITVFTGEKIKRYDLKELYHIHRAYEIKRQKIQKLSKSKPKTSKRLLRKYSQREKNKTKDFMHKLTTRITQELKNSNSGAIMEDLKRIKDKILNGSKSQNRKLSKWNARTFQTMLEYKLKWMGLPVKYVDARNTSRVCPLCSGYLVAYEGRLTKCGNCNLILDRDVVAVLNLQMRGFPTPVRDWKESILPVLRSGGGYPERGRKSQGLRRPIKAYVN